MSKKIIIMFTDLIFVVVILIPFYTFGLQDEVSENLKNPVEKNEKVSNDNSALEYDLTEVETQKYKVTYRMNVWDDKLEKFIEDYSISGTLSLTLKGVDDKGQYLIEAESLLESALVKGKEMSRSVSEYPQFIASINIIHV